MRHNNGVFRALANLRVGGVIVNILCAQAISLRQLHHSVHDSGALVSKGVWAFRGHRHRWNGHQLSQVLDDIVPIIQNLFAKHRITSS